MEVGRSSLPFIYLLNLTGNPEFLQRVRDKIDITFQTSGVHKNFLNGVSIVQKLEENYLLNPREFPVFVLIHLESMIIIICHRF